MKKPFLFATLLLVASCKTIEPDALVQRLSDDERALADSLLALALDNEALYTLVEPIKPISTVMNFSLPIARPDSLPSGVRDATNPNADALNRLRRLQKVVNELRLGDARLFLVPFKRADNGKRYFEVVAVNLKLLSRAIAKDQAFWGQWGFVPEANPAIVLTAIEFEEKLDRYRGYGYLFGYPEHAITFFVEAARSEDATKRFVERDFFHIPVFSSETGHFTYAIPKGYAPTETDSAIYRKAMATLLRYKAIRPEFVGKDGRLRALQLWERLNELRAP